MERHSSLPSGQGDLFYLPGNWHLGKVISNVRLGVSAKKKDERALFIMPESILKIKSKGCIVSSQSILLCILLNTHL